jgi:hypothetical protein
LRVSGCGGPPVSEENRVLGFLEERRMEKLLSMKILQLREQADALG